VNLINVSWKLQAWQQVCTQVLRPEQPFELHKQLFAAIYSSWSEERLGPAPVWVPDAHQVQQTNIACFMDRFHVSDNIPVLTPI
jgi:acetyl-CoA synthetase